MVPQVCSVINVLPLIIPNSTYGNVILCMYKGITFVTKSSVN